MTVSTDDLGGIIEFVGSSQIFEHLGRACSTQKLPCIPNLACRSMHDHRNLSDLSAASILNAVSFGIPEL